MKKLSTVMITTILSGTIGLTPFIAGAATPQTASTAAAQPNGQASSATTTASQNQQTPTAASGSQQQSSLSPADQHQYKQMLQEASQLMGYVGIANIALLHNMINTASTNVQQALTLARTLEGQTTQLNADAMKSGKLQYKSASGESHDYWLPIENDTFVVNDLDTEYLKSKQPKAAEEDAQIVNTKVVLDTRQVLESLEKAATAMNAKNYGAAQAALWNAQQSTFTGDTIVELPLVTAHDNLALADNLAKSKDYAGANYALNHANDALKTYQSSVTGAKSTEVQQMETQISALQSQINQHQPSTMANIDKSINGWMQQINQLM